MDQLAEAKKHVDHADEYGTQLDARLAIAHALIAIAERLPPPTEPWSERYARLRKEEKESENGI